MGLVDCYTGALDGVPLLSKEMQQVTGNAEAVEIQRVAAELQLRKPRSCLCRRLTMDLQLVLAGIYLYVRV